MTSINIVAFILLFTSFVQFVQAQDEGVPYRSEATYKFELDYSFKTKPPPPQGHVSFTNGNIKRTELLPYVKIELHMLELMDQDHRVKIKDNRGASVYNKRLREPLKIDMDMGFAEDLKDKIVAHIYHVYFIDKEKNIQSQIVIEVKETGDLLLNNELYGKL